MEDDYQRLIGRGTTVRGDDLSSLLQRANESLQERLEESTNRCGLTESRFQVLAVLAESGEQGCSQTELAQQLSQSDSSICGLVDRMQEDGLLFRFRSKVDRRRSLLMLSQEGRERWSRAVHLRSIQIDRMIGGYPEANRLRLAGQLNEFLAHLLAATPLAPSSPGVTGSSADHATTKRSHRIRTREAG